MPVAASVNESPPIPPPGTDPSALGSEDFAAVYQEHSQAIYYLALRYLGDPNRAQDVTHDVFLKAWQHLGEFRHDSSWRTWLYRIAINHCRNLAASWASRNLVSSSDDAVWDSAPSPGDSPLRVLEIKELGERIGSTLSHLPEEYRLLLLLVADERLSYTEIGELTGQSPDAVRGKLHRARKAFAAAFATTA
jgi:RNA polymerase sigma-70 factor (ECF subfamily)